MTKRVGHVAKDDIYINTVDLAEPAEHLQITVSDYTGQHVATVHVIGASTLLQLYSSNSYEVNVEQQPMCDFSAPVADPDVRDSWAHQRIGLLATRVDELAEQLRVLNSHTHGITPALNPYATGGPLARSVTDATACTCPPWGNPSWPHRHGCPAAPGQTGVVSGGDQLG